MTQPLITVIFDVGIPSVIRWSTVMIHAI